jgi:arabinogalactan endo-1,4-beta-galactosidase
MPSGGTAGSGGSGGSSAGAGGSAGASAGAGDEAGAAGSGDVFPISIPVCAGTPVMPCLTNPSFDNGNGGEPTTTGKGNPIQGWLSNPSGVGSGIYIDYPGTSNSGFGHLAMYSPDAYVASAWQEVTGLTNGTYTLAAWFDGTATGVTQLHFIYTTAYSGAASAVDPATMTAGPEITPNGLFNAYEQQSLENIVVTNGKLIIGLHAEANAGVAMNMDDVTLVRTQ